MLWKIFINGRNMLNISSISTLFWLLNNLYRTSYIWFYLLP